MTLIKQSHIHQSSKCANTKAVCSWNIIVYRCNNKLFGSITYNILITRIQNTTNTVEYPITKNIFNLIDVTIVDSFVRNMFLNNGAHLIGSTVLVLSNNKL